MDYSRKAVDRLLKRNGLESETRQELESLQEGLMNLPRVTSDINLSLVLRLGDSKECHWFEMRLTGDEFELSEGTYTQLGGGEAHSNVVFSVSPGYRDGDAFSGSSIAERIFEAAEDESREIEIH